MRAFREIFGGLFLAALAAATVIGGLWLAVTETGINFGQPTAIAAVTLAESPTAFIPSQTAKPLPSNTATLKATTPPTATFTATLAPSLTFTATSAASLSPTASATEVAPSQTATFTATVAPTATPIGVVSSPTVCAPPASWVQYVVAPGDTLFALSLRYGVSQQQLQNANCLASTEIKSGQVLFVPFVASATPQAATATATTVPSATPVPSPLIIEDVTVVGVQSDPSRPNGAIATLFIKVSGGQEPYTFYNGNSPEAGNPFQVLTDCNGTILFTLQVLSADGQSVDKTYYYSPVTCP